MLRDEALSIDNLALHLISELLFQNVINDLKGPTSIMAAQVFYIFQNEGRWFVDLEDLFYREKEIALFLIFEAVLVARSFRVDCHGGDTVRCG